MHAQPHEPCLAGQVLCSFLPLISFSEALRPAEPAWGALWGSPACSPHSLFFPEICKGDVRQLATPGQGGVELFWLRKSILRKPPPTLPTINTG